MLWSYSRISAFSFCKYRFLISYIKKVPKARLFFSDYGSFIHKILQKYYDGELSQDSLVCYFLTNFKSNVLGKPPSQKIFTNYFNQGLEYFKSFQPTDENIVGVEKEVSFSIGDREFVGFIDKVSIVGDELVITDNKSRDLRKRSTRKKPTKTDEELDSYLKQLYIYSIPIEEEYHKLPDKLVFNCFRTQTVIEEPFSYDAFVEAKRWAEETIKLIGEENDWKPDIEFFKCKYICDCNEQCEYFQIYGGD